MEGKGKRKKRRSMDGMETRAWRKKEGEKVRENNGMREEKREIGKTGWRR